MNKARSVRAGLVLVCLCVTNGLWAAPLYERAVKLFMDNKPAEAAPLFELAVRESGANETLYLYLGIAYQQLGKWDEAIAAFRKGLPVSGANKHQLLFNIGNSFYAQDKGTFALEYYDQALNAKRDYAAAYLNRANAKLRLNDMEGAVQDYVTYLGLEPSSQQSDEIRRLIELLTAKAAAAARQKAEAEAKRLAEEQAKKALLDEVAKSLLQAAESTTNLSAGSGDVQGYDPDLSLDD